MVRKILYLFIILTLLISTINAAPENEYAITYTINIKEDGSALWDVEYRTPLNSKGDFDSFENYSKQLESVYLKEFKELMQKSVSEAANATSRKMTAEGFEGDARVQSSPTGAYGVVRYSFVWTNFAKVELDKINAGDVFAGGLYLSKDNTLIIRYPQDYNADKVTPRPDAIRDEFVWYGLRSFNAGEPEIVLSKASFQWLPVVAIFIIAGALLVIIKVRRKKPKDIVEYELEDKIIKLLKENNSALYQSEIVKKLELPKSTVSSALNELHNKNLIDKIKKGRENLVRLK